MDYQCRSKRQSVHILFVWCSCPLCLFSYPFGRSFTEHTPLSHFLISVTQLTAKTYLMSEEWPIMAFPSHTWFVLYRLIAIITDMEWLIHCKYTIVSAITQLPRLFLLPRLLWEYRVELITMELPCIVFIFPAKIFCRSVSGFVTGCLCGVWGGRLTSSSLWACVGIFANLNKLICMFDRMENSFSLLCKYIDIFYHLPTSVCFTVIFTSRITFKLT